MGVEQAVKPRSNSWPAPAQYMEEMNSAVQKAIQEQVATQLAALRPTLSQMQPIVQTVHVGLSVDSTEINFYEPGKTPPPVVKPVLKLPELSPGPPGWTMADTEDFVQFVAKEPLAKPPMHPHSAPAAISILQSSPTLAPTSF